MDQTTQESPCRDNHCAGRQLTTINQANADDPIVCDDQLVRLTLDHAEIDGLANGGLHGCRIELAVGLGARTPHRRTLAAVEHAKLDAGGIGNAAHQPIQRVDLADQMALAEPPDRGIAGHRPDGRKPMCYQRRPGAHARGRARGFAAGVTSADDDYVE